MARILYVPHGGGPLPLLNNPGYASLAASLRSFGVEVANSKAIVLVTAHWESPNPRLTSAAHPELLYDYYGFPEASYQIKYPAPGAPELAQRVADALARDGFTPELDAERGFDHGVFVPMILMRPLADIPILQMSLLSSLDAAQHVLMGQSLARVLGDDITLIGSGYSFHNMGALTGRGAIEASQGKRQAAVFHDWLDGVICDPALDHQARAEALIGWEHAPGARFCHPREEHLLPLHVCFGAAQAAGLAGTRIFSEAVVGFQTSGYQW